LIPRTSATGSSPPSAVLRHCLIQNRFLRLPATIAGGSAHLAVDVCSVAHAAQPSRRLCLPCGLVKLGTYRRRGLAKLAPPRRTATSAISFGQAGLVREGVGIVSLHLRGHPKAFQNRT